MVKQQRWDIGVARSIPPWGVGIARHTLGHCQVCSEAGTEGDGVPRPSYLKTPDGQKMAHAALSRRALDGTCTAM